jgi:hypothetical protein
MSAIESTTAHLDSISTNGHTEGCNRSRSFAGAPCHCGDRCPKCLRSTRSLRASGLLRAASEPEPMRRATPPLRVFTTRGGVL